MMRGPGLSDPRHISGGGGHFIGSGSKVGAAAGSDVVNLSGGILVGDMIVGIGTEFSSTSSIVGGNALLNASGTGYHLNAMWILADASMQAAQQVPVFGGGGNTYTFGVYRGPTVATLPIDGFHDNTTPSPVICPGFTKNVGAQVVAYFIGAPTNPLYGVGPGTLRATSADGHNAFADFDPATLYTNGTAEPWAYSSLANLFILAIDLH